MAPTYDVDTLLLVKKTEPEEIREGDVISFYSMDPALDGAVNTHRIVSVEKEGDGYLYKTKGDANNVADAYEVQSEYLLGKVIWSSLIHTVRLAKKISREEEEAAVREAVEELRRRKQEKDGGCDSV